MGFREKINREAATLGRSGRELGQPELGKRVRTQKKKKKRKRLITNGSVMGNELEWCTM